MGSSILDDVKQMLGIEIDDPSFDREIVLHINSVFLILNQLGVGPPDGYRIFDRSQNWNDFVSTRVDVEALKSYVYLKVRLLFDPPTSSFVLESINKMASEFEWRLNVQVDRGDFNGPAERND